MDEKEGNPCADMVGHCVAMDMNDMDATVSEEEKLVKIREIFDDFFDKVMAIEKERDAKLSKIMEGIDQRKIDKIIKGLHEDM